MLRPRVKGIHKPMRLTPTLINIGGRQLGIGAEIDDEDGTIWRLLGFMDGTRRLKPDEKVILRDAHARDVQVSRWYRLLYVTGITWMGWFAYFYLWPSAKVVFGWMGGVLRDAPIGSYGWWEAIVLGAFAAFNLFLPLAVVVRNRREARRALA